MKKGKIQEIVARLRHELQQAQDVDAEARTKAEELRRDVERLRNADDADVDSLLDRARELETRFAARHPTLEGIARDLADAIAKMGV
jgi:predicted  nucleic acid-binding Zn-ribbon protein